MVLGRRPLYANMSLLMVLQSRRNTMRTTLHLVCGIAFILLLACAANAQGVNIWPGVAPGSESWTQKERTVENTPLGTVVFNVVTPTLTAYLPERTKATGTGVIIAPGGAFVALA